MKKFIISVFAVTAVIISAYFAYFSGAYVFKNKNASNPAYFTRVEGDQIYITENGAEHTFEMRGVNLGVGKPGHFAVEYAVTYEEYLRWFSQIAQMGANTIRVYTFQNEDFYRAFYDYNTAADAPLYLLHGVWVDDYVLNSHYDAYDPQFISEFISDIKETIDIVHGRKNKIINSEKELFRYRYDVSPWLLGYLPGVEWEPTLVAYTDHHRANETGYEGKYLKTTPEASAFETALCRAGDALIKYETEKYGQQHLLAFSNWCTSDPIDHPNDIDLAFSKYAEVDVEHIVATDDFKAGQFASYHVYAYYPDYYSILEDKSAMTDEAGYANAYLYYLKLLTAHHTMPVVITEFGMPTSRGCGAVDHSGMRRNQGGITEHEQALGLISCYEDIIASGCRGGIVFSWHDEWFKRTWNTMENIDLERTPYWSDYQTNEQYFGILAFDPGKDALLCKTDGDASEWAGQSLVCGNETLGVRMMYDERYIYFYIHCSGYDPEKDTIYLPIDTTQKSGSMYCADKDLKFDRYADFLITIAPDQSRVTVQERYDVFRATKDLDSLEESAYLHIPDVNSDVFNPIRLVLQSDHENAGHASNVPYKMVYYETGVLRQGNGDPDAEDFDSMSDYCVKGDDIELRIPWQMLNFADASEMKIHDDYYENYGVAYQNIDEMYVGVTKGGSERVQMNAFALSGWGYNVTYHERLKEAYYALQSLWSK